MWAIVSNNCWGSNLYQERQLQYNAPFVGLWLFPADYLRLLQNFRECVIRPLDFYRGPDRPGDYPVGMLGDVQVNFMHYKTEQDAREKWERRVARLPASDDDLF